MFILMRILKCSSSWAPNKDHLCTQQTYKASIGKSLDLNPLGELPDQVSFPALPFNKCALYITWHACSLANGRLGTKFMLRSPMGLCR